jgi:hypothetical protein
MATKRRQQPKQPELDAFASESMQDPQARLRATQAEPPPAAPRMNDGVSCRMSTETRHQYESFCSRQAGAFTPSDLLRLGAALLFRNLTTLEGQIAMLCDKVAPRAIRDQAATAGLRAVLRVLGSSLAKVTVASEVLTCEGKSVCCWAIGEGLTVRYGCVKLNAPAEAFWHALKYPADNNLDAEIDWQEDLATWLAERGIGVVFSFGEGA